MAVIDKCSRTNVPLLLSLTPRNYWILRERKKVLTYGIRRAIIVATQKEDQTMKHITAFLLLVAPSLHGAENQWCQSWFWKGALPQDIVTLERSDHTCNEEAGSIVHFAARYASPTVLEEYLQKNPHIDIDAVDGFGNTSLSREAERGNLAAVTLLLESGADVDKKNTLGNAPLTFAAYNGNTAVIEKLVENHADVNTKNVDGQTPWDMARGRGFRDVARLLEKFGATTPSLWEQFLNLFI